MNRQLFESIIKSIDGITAQKNVFTISDNHSLTIYVGDPGKSLIIAQIQSCSLKDDFVIVSLREPKRTFYLPYDKVYALSHASENTSEQRAGFA